MDYRSNEFNIYTVTTSKPPSFPKWGRTEDGAKELRAWVEGNRTRNN
jgi:hypothetical protein